MAVYNIKIINSDGSSSLQAIGSMADFVLLEDQTTSLTDKLKTIDDAIEAKASKDIVTTTENGLMSSEDKVKLDSITAGGGGNIDVVSKESIGDLQLSVYKKYIPDISTIAYWNGQYEIGMSNLAYCNQGAFGSIVVKNSEDYLSTTGGILTGALTGTSATFSDTLTANKVYGAVWNDYAEYFERGEDTEVGDIIALDLHSGSEKYVKAINGDVVCGVHSDTYGHLIGGKSIPADYTGTYEDYNNDSYIPVGMIGRVYCKVYGTISKGDKIYASDIAGVGTVEYSGCKEQSFVGYACESYNSNKIGKIKILLKK